jgi:adenine-specific DNA-methyltransferase
MPAITPRKAISKAYLKVKPLRGDIEQFKENLTNLLDRNNDKESEEFHKNNLSDFLKKTYYDPEYYINTKGRNDLVIHNNKSAKDTVGVIIEAKRIANSSEMLKQDTLNVKAMQELVLYYLRERITLKNLEVKHLIVTNINEWFIFDANVFEKSFAENKKLVHQFQDFESGILSGTGTDFFYENIAKPAIDLVKETIEFAHFNVGDFSDCLSNEKKDDSKLIPIFKILSPQHLLKTSFLNDSNSLNRGFYTELLHIIGLEETKDGNRKLIARKQQGERHSGTLIENSILEIESLEKLTRFRDIKQYGETKDDQLFNIAIELAITWVNRILFLKLLEAQLVNYHKGDKSYAFLNTELVKNLDELNALFFQVLAIRPKERNIDVQKKFSRVPYLNSSLFEPAEIEHNFLFVSNLSDEKKIPILSTTVLKNKQGKRIYGELSAIEYLFRFWMLMILLATVAKKYRKTIKR